MKEKIIAKKKIRNNKNLFMRVPVCLNLLVTPLIDREGVQSINRFHAFSEVYD